MGEVRAGAVGAGESGMREAIFGSFLGEMVDMFAAAIKASR